MNLAKAQFEELAGIASSGQKVKNCLAVYPIQGLDGKPIAKLNSRVDTTQVSWLEPKPGRTT